jgi:pilus assembly protein CpaB
MNIRTLATVAVAVMLGLVATLLVRSYVHRAPGAGQAAASVPTQTVVVAARAIERGEPLAADAVKIVSYPANVTPAGAYTTLAAMTGAQGVRRALQPLAVNQPILQSEVSGPRANGGISVVLAPGLRAISVRTNDVTGVGGFVLPGDRVDVLVARPTGGEAALNTLAQTIAQNVRVMGVDQMSQTDKPVVTKAVTLEVSPDQAQSITLAQTVGTISLSLRNETDDARPAATATTVSDLGGAPRHAPIARRTAAEPAPQGLVRVTRGVESRDYAVAHD